MISDVDTANIINQWIKNIYEKNTIWQLCIDLKSI